MAATNSELVQFALLKVNVIAENESPTAEQGVIGLNVLNDMLANQAADGMHLGWYPQTDISADAPLRPQDVGPVKYLLARALAAHYGITLNALLVDEIMTAERQLTKRSLRYSEADLSELPRAQGTFSGGWY